MAIAEQNIDTALMTSGGSTSVSLQRARVQAREYESSDNTVPNRHHVRRSGHFRFFNRRETRVPWNKGSSWNKAAVQTKRVSTIPRRKNTVNIITIAIEKLILVRERHFVRGGRAEPHALVYKVCNRLGTAKTSNCELAHPKAGIVAVGGPDYRRVSMVIRHKTLQSNAQLV